MMMLNQDDSFFSPSSALVTGTHEMKRPLSHVKPNKVAGTDRVPVLLKHWRGRLYAVLNILLNIPLEWVTVPTCLKFAAERKKNN